MNKILLSLILLIPFSLFSQNLVPNPGFEKFSDCPASLGQCQLAKFWTCPNSGTPDYFNDCTPSLEYGTEFNKKGGQVPHSGHAYMGFQSENLNRNEFYEYLETSLTSSLAADSFYCIRMYVSLGTSTASLNDLGVVFSQNEIQSTGAAKIKIPFTHVGNGRILSDSIHWVCISGTYKATGGEKFMTLGDFTSENDFVFPQNNSGNAPIFQIAYYFIDDITVEKATDPANCNCIP